MRVDIKLLKTVTNIQSKKSLPIKAKNLQLNSFKVLRLDCMFAVLALIRPYFLNKKNLAK